MLPPVAGHDAPTSTAEEKGESHCEKLALVWCYGGATLPLGCTRDANKAVAGIRGGTVVLRLLSGLLTGVAKIVIVTASLAPFSPDAAPRCKKAAGLLHPAVRSTLNGQFCYQSPTLPCRGAKWSLSGWRWGTKPPSLTQVPAATRGLCLGIGPT